MKNTVNYKSRFRILKGGKISLVVSALLASASLVGTSADAASICTTTYTIGDEGTQQSIEMCENTNINVTGTLNVASATVDDSALKLTQVAALGSYEATIVNDAVIRGLMKNAGSAIDLTGIAKFSLTNNAGKAILIEAGGVATGVKATNASGSSIENAGSILSKTSANAKGIDVSGYLDASSIKNLAGAAILTTSTNGDSVGISVSELKSTSSIENAGGIGSYAATTAMGIHVSSFLDSSSITNLGTGRIIVGDLRSGTTMVGINAEQLKNSSSIKNAGIIDVKSTDVAVGIAAKLLNSTIENTGRISVAGTTVIGIKSDELDASSIKNLGTGKIIVRAESTGIGIYVTGLKNGSTIENAASIDVVSGGGAYGIIIGGDNMLDTSSIINSGTITINGHSSSQGIKATDGKIENSGTIRALISSNAHKNAYSIVALNSVVNNSASGKLYGNINITGNGTLTNAGLISLPHDADNAQIYKFINESTGTLEIGLSTDGTTTTYSKLATTGATFKDGSTIAVNVLSTSTNVELLAGNLLEGVVSSREGGITIDGKLNITDNSALLNFEYEVDAGNIDLKIVEGKTIVEAVTNTIMNSVTNSTGNGAGGRNLQAAAGALQTIQGNDLFIAALNKLPTDAAVAEAVKATTPVVAGAVAGASTQISNGIQGIVQTRQRVNFNGGLNSGEEMFSEKNLWVKAFGSFGTQDDQDGINGFDLNTYGLGLGVDAEYASNQTIGLALFYTRANVDVNNISQSSDLDVYTALVYGNVPFLDPRTNFLYQVGYAWQKTSSQRYIAITNATATADYTTNTASVDLKVVRDYQINKKFLVQPMLEATYRKFSSPTYTESGAGAVNLKSESYNSNEFILGLGVVTSMKIDNDAKLFTNLNIGYDVKGNHQTVTSSYAGSTGVQFDTNGIDNGRYNYDIGLGYERDVKEGHNINLSYNYQGQGTGFTNHVVSAKYVFSF
ncbi:MAG: autotransporter domain-containing protein [Sulfurimonas sp.]|nr:autotransporter domain-containing protein [Sulfurimonas sp.]MDQ7062243.1 autotransporter domain-containing protein [Sulfurimonas sp.]